MKIIRRVYAKIGQFLKFLGLRCSHSGEKRDIVYVPWSGKRNAESGTNIASRNVRKRTTVLTGYTPPKKHHHSATGFSYSISDRECKRWTNDEWDKLVELKKESKSIKEIASILGRSENAITCKITYMRKKEK